MCCEESNLSNWHDEMKEPILLVETKKNWHLRVTGSTKAMFCWCWKHEGENSQYMYLFIFHSFFVWNCIFRRKRSFSIPEHAELMWGKLIPKEIQYNNKKRMSNIGLRFIIPWLLPQRISIWLHRYYSGMFFAALFIIAMKKKQPKCPFILWEDNEMWYMYTMKYYSVAQKK